MESMAGEPDAEARLDALDVALAGVQELDLESLTGEQRLRVAGRLERARRRLDHGSCRVVDELDRSGGFDVDGHRNAKAAIAHVCRISGAEALGRVRTARAWRQLPTVQDAYGRGEIPVESMRAIAKAAANPRVGEHLGAADTIFSAQARKETVADFAAWIRQCERLADQDGAESATNRAHKRRNVSLVQNEIDGSWILHGTFGPLQGAVLNRILTRFEDAEFQADWDEAKERCLGEQPRLEELERTSRQRRADAVLSIFRRAAAMPADASSPEPLVSIVMTQDAFEAELARLAGNHVDVDPLDPDRYRCHTDLGEHVPASEALQAALVGHVRRVVVEAPSNVIDLGRRRRLFTGSSRRAVEIQAMLRGRSGLCCRWPGCHGHPNRLEADHRRSAARGGPTNPDNGDLYCGVHNRIKERGFTPVRNPDGTWTMHRPDGTPITPAV